MGEATAMEPLCARLHPGRADPAVSPAGIGTTAAEALVLPACPPLRPRPAPEAPIAAAPAGASTTVGGNCCGRRRRRPVHPRAGSRNRPKCSGMPPRRTSSSRGGTRAVLNFSPKGIDHDSLAEKIEQPLAEAIKSGRIQASLRSRCTTPSMRPAVTLL